METGSKYKFSLFNSIISVGDKTDVLYNAFSDRFMLVRKGLIQGRLLESVKRTELIDNLIEGGFIVEKTLDEVEAVKQLSQRVDENEEMFNLIINPTLNCNFNCWYCYEAKTTLDMMSERILNRVKKFIQRTAAKCSSFHISFFGGEPLLGYQKVVKPLIIYANEVCKDSGTELSISFTSNGYLLTEEMILFFKENRVFNFQITLDGNRKLHNQTRCLKNGSGSYSKIIQNVILLLENEFYVTLRFNYTDKNIASFIEVVEDLQCLDKQQKSFLMISLHQVWQNVSVDLRKEVIRVMEYYNLNGFSISPPIFDNVRNSCYADKKNNALINYNGDVFKCSAVDFENAKREGLLGSDGIILWENNSLEARLKSKFKNKPCLECRLLPICNGACSQKAIEYQNYDYCILSYSEDKKDEVVLDRFCKYISEINNI